MLNFNAYHIFVFQTLYLNDLHVEQTLGGSRKNTVYTAILKSYEWKDIEICAGI